MGVIYAIKDIFQGVNISKEVNKVNLSPTSVCRTPPSATTNANEEKVAETPTSNLTPDRSVSAGQRANHQKFDSVTSAKTFVEDKIERMTPWTPVTDPFQYKYLGLDHKGEAEVYIHSINTSRVGDGPKWNELPHKFRDSKEDIERYGRCLSNNNRAGFRIMVKNLKAYMIFIMEMMITKQSGVWYTDVDLMIRCCYWAMIDSMRIVHENTTPIEDYPFYIILTLASKIFVGFFVLLRTKNLSKKQETRILSGLKELNQQLEYFRGIYQLRATAASRSKFTYAQPPHANYEKIYIDLEKIAKKYHFN